MIINVHNQSYQVLTKLTNSGENRFPFSHSGDKRGGSPSTTWFNCSNTVFHLGYGKRPVAISINVIPNDQTSERTSYPLPRFGSILSG